MPQTPARSPRAAKRATIDALRRTSPARKRCAPWLALLACSCASVCAQSTQPAMIPFVDRGFGYQMSVPAGWTYDRTAFFGPGGSTGLLRGAGTYGLESLQVLMFHDVSAPTMREWIDYFVRQLGGISGVTKVLAKYQDEVASSAEQRPYGYVLVQAHQGADRIETVYYCLRFDPQTVWVLARAALAERGASAPPDAATDRSADFNIPPSFQAMVDSLRVLHNPAVAAEMRAAQKRGEQFIASQKLQEAIRRLRIDENERFYQILLAGKPIGYMTRRFSREWRGLDAARAGNKKEGVRVRETSWRFADDGSVFRSNIDLFSSVDGASDLIEITETRVPPANADPKSAATHPIVTTRDQCIREGDVLFSSFRSSLDPSMPDPRTPIKLGPSYLGLAWVRLLPALLGRDAAAAIGFQIYDPQTRALISHSMSSLGEKPVSESLPRAFAYESREGVIDKPALTYADARGHAIRIEAGELVIQLADAATIESSFAARRDVAQRRIATMP